MSKQKQESENIVVYPDGRLEFGGKEYRCALGKGGVTKDKKEGDGCTPVGCFHIREIFYRKDRLGEKVFPFVTHITTEEDVWGDNPKQPFYNQHTRVDKTKTTELLWRGDAIYDVVVVLGYNDDPVVAGKGSAIFMHVARENYTPTEGCVALSLDDLLSILGQSTRDTKVCVRNFHSL